MVEVKADVSNAANGTQTPAVSLGCPELCMWDTINATKRVLPSAQAEESSLTLMFTYVRILNPQVPAIDKPFFAYTLRSW